MEYTKKKNWIIAIAVAIVYLTISILFDLWFFSWIIWVAYAIKSFPTCRTIEIIVQSGKIDICDCLITVWRQRTMEQRVF